MACSKRVDTVSELRPRQFEKRETPEGEHWLCTVEGKDSTDREAATRPRGVFIPDDIMDDLLKYIDRNNIGDDERLFKHSTRTIQRDVKRSAKNAATKTDNDDFKKISSHDLRRYFATHLLYRHEVPPPVVRALGGWKSDEAMFEYLVLPDDVLFERLGEAGLLGTSYDKLGRHDYTGKLSATISRLTDLLQKVDQDTAETAAEDVTSAINTITMETEDASTSSSDQHHPNQTSLNQSIVDDESASDSGDKEFALGPILAAWTSLSARLKNEWELLISAPNTDIPTELNRDVLTRLGVFSLSIFACGLFMGWSGWSQGLVTGDPSYTIPGAVGVVFMIPWLIWRTTETYRPPGVEPETAFDRFIVAVHSTMDPIMQRVP